MGDRLDKDIASMKINKGLISITCKILLQKDKKKDKKTDRKLDKGYCGNMSCKLQMF